MCHSRAVVIPPAVTVPCHLPSSHQMSCLSLLPNRIYCVNAIVVTIFNNIFISAVEIQTDSVSKFCHFLLPVFRQVVVLCPDFPSNLFVWLSMRYFLSVDYHQLIFGLPVSECFRNKCVNCTPPTFGIILPPQLQSKNSSEEFCLFLNWLMNKTMANQRHSSSFSIKLLIMLFSAIEVLYPFNSLIWSEILDFRLCRVCHLLTVLPLHYSCLRLCICGVIWPVTSPGIHSVLTFLLRGATALWVFRHLSRHQWEHVERSEPHNTPSVESMSQPLPGWVVCVWEGHACGMFLNMCLTLIMGLLVL